MPTRTGNFAVGFRRGWSDWQKDLAALAKWTKSNGLDGIDLGNPTPAEIQTLTGAGLRLGSVDLKDFGQITANDAAKRKDVVAANVAYVKQLAAAGAKVFFTCIMPGDIGKSRKDNYASALESFGPIAQAAQQAGTVIVIEGWPGGDPHLANLCCTPETCRAIIKDLGKGIGLNYDPSHLIRLGVDHVRFLREFAPHVHHVHAKDTELMSEAAYEYGLYQPAAFANGHGFGAHVWRYTIPGAGCARWTEIFKILQAGGYKGMVSVELEDENFNGSEGGEKAGLLNSLAFLRGA
jgi:sugar phosphate isomerase/epimerase